VIESPAVTDREIDSALYALTGEETRVRLTYGSDPIYVVGVLREEDGLFILQHDFGEAARFRREHVAFVSIAVPVIELKEGEGEYWPPFVADRKR
jgi:hypothetical protein